MDIIRNLDIDGAECRHEDAVYYANGKAALLTGSPESGYRVERTTTVMALALAEPEAWTHIYFMHQSEQGKFAALAGETSWAGAGFVALRRLSGEFCWIVHLSNCNNFISLSINSSTVTAISDALAPRQARFEIPIDFPEKINVSSHKG